MSEIVPDPLRARLASGEVVVESGEGAGGRREARARALIAAPIEKVWEAITDYDRYKEFMPFTTASEVRRRDGDRILFYSELAVPLKKIWYEIEIEIDRPRWRTRWRRVDGTLKANDGSWQLEPRGTGETAALYTVHVELGIWVPGFLLDRFTGAGLAQLMRAVRRRAGDRKYA